MNWKSPSYGLYGNLARAIFLSLLVLVSLLVWLFLLTKPEDLSQDPAKVEVKLYVAASLVDVVEKTVREFNEEYGSQFIIARVGGSGDLVGQIQLERTTGVRGGADILITADDSFLQPMNDAGMVDRQQTLAYQTLVMATSESNHAAMARIGLASVGDLIDSDLNFGISVQQAAAGRVVRQLAGVQVDRLESRAKMQSENVMALGQALALGQLDIAVVWDTVVHQINRNHESGSAIGQRLVILHSLGSKSRSSISLAVIKGHRFKAETEAKIDVFLQYLEHSEAWKSRLTRQGFAVAKQRNGWQRERSVARTSSGESTAGEEQ